MTDRIPYADTVIFTGRFGSGKSETAINYATSLGRRLPGGEGAPGSDKGRPVGAVLIDLDIVTPYFRSRETADRLLKLGVRVVAPSVIGQHLDDIDALLQIDRGTPGGLGDIAVLEGRLDE